MNSQFFDKNGRIINFYKMFNIDSNVSQDQLRASFSMLIKKYHPDTAENKIKNSGEIISLIINGYRILSDVDLKRNYDIELINENLKNHNSIVPGNRIKYSFSLGEVLKLNLNPKKMKRNHLLSKIGQDVEVLITKLEALTGAKAFIELPSRTSCPVCLGESSNCYLCDGLGRIFSRSLLEVKIPSKTKTDFKKEFNLLKMKPDNFTTFSMSSITIKITIV